MGGSIANCVHKATTVTDHSSIKQALDTVHRTQFSTQYTAGTVHNTQYIVHSTHYTVHSMEQSAQQALDSGLDLVVVSKGSLGHIGMIRCATQRTKRARKDTHSV